MVTRGLLPCTALAVLLSGCPGPRSVPTQGSTPDGASPDGASLPPGADLGGVAPPGDAELWFAHLASVRVTEALGQGSKNGAELAAEEINAAGGVLGRRLRIRTISEDEHRLDRVVQDIVDDPEIVGIIGPNRSASAYTMIPAIAGKLVAISPTATSEGLTDFDDDDCFFRTAPSDRWQGFAAADYVFFELGAKTVAVIHDDGPFGQGLAKRFSERFERRGGTVLASVGYPLQEEYRVYDFGPAAQQVFAERPEAVFLAGYSEPLARFIAATKEDPGYRAVAATVKFMGCSVFALEAAAVDPSVVDGRLYGTIPGPGRDRSGYDAFAAAYAEEFHMPMGESPLPLSEASYDAVYSMAYAVQRAGTADRLALRDQLRAVTRSPGERIKIAQWAAGLRAIGSGAEIDYDGPTGPIDLDAAGDPAPSFAIYQIARGSMQIIVKEYTGWHDPP